MALNTASSGSLFTNNGAAPPGMAGATRFTVMLWLLQNAWTGSRGIWGMGNAVEIIQYGATDQVVFFFNTGSQYGQTPVGAVPVGGWHHVCFAFVGDSSASPGAMGVRNLVCYVDGAQVALIYSGNTPATIGTPSNFRILDGNTFGITANHAQAHLRGWAADLTQREVQQEMMSYWAVRQANLKFDFPEDDGTPVHTPSTGVIPVDYSQNISGVPIVTDTITQVSGPPSVTRRVPVLAI